MKTFKCRCGKDILVDEQDYDLSQYSWRCHNYQLIAKLGSKSIGLNNIMSARLKLVGKPDHKDRDIHNIQRSNFRSATDQQSARNRGLFKNSKSGYKGVCLIRGFWEAYIYVDKTKIPLGKFTIKEDAARAYDTKAVELFGEFAALNFPNETLHNTTTN